VFLTGICKPAFLFFSPLFFFAANKIRVYLCPSVVNQFLAREIAFLYFTGPAFQHFSFQVVLFQVADGALRRPLSGASPSSAGQLPSVARRCLTS